MDTIQTTQGEYSNTNNYYQNVKIIFNLRRLVTGEEEDTEKRITVDQEHTNLILMVTIPEITNTEEIRIMIKKLIKWGSNSIK
jgi:hypothetical protein